MILTEISPKGEEKMSLATQIYLTNLKFELALARKRQAKGDRMAYLDINECQELIKRVEADYA